MIVFKALESYAMKTISNIVVFDNDQYLLALLKGYCFANNIAIKPSDFEMESVKEVEKLLPSIVLIPIGLLNSKNKSLETALLRRVGASSHVSIVGLLKNSTEVVPTGLLAWVDEVINHPFDICEFGEYVSKILLYINEINERRVNGERRSYERRSHAGRRSGEFIQNGFHFSQEVRKLGQFQDAENPTSKHLYIDNRNKCLFLKGSKVDLTPKEFELLEFLATDTERIFTADEIIKHLWPTSHRATKSDLYQYMHLLRKKIENDPDNPQCIVTVKGFGYKLNVNAPIKTAS
jgi:DNA-binding response OmpR family regulator